MLLVEREAAQQTNKKKELGCPFFSSTLGQEVRGKGKEEGGQGNGAWWPGRWFSGFHIGIRSKIPETYPEIYLRQRHSSTAINPRHRETRETQPLGKPPF